MIRWLVLACWLAAASLALGCDDGGAPGQPGPAGGHGASGGAGAAAPGGGGAGPVGGGGAGGSSPAGGGGVCPAGSEHVTSQLACDQSDVEPTPELLAAATSGTPGQVVSLGGLDGNGVPCLPVHVCRPDDAATLLFSDEPESVAQDGVLFAEQIEPGRFRAYVYHVNASASARKFPIVALNQGTAAATLTIVRRGLAGPTSSYAQAGKLAALQWIAPATPSTVTVPAGQRVLVDEQLDTLHANQDQLVHAIIDFVADAPVKLSVVSVPASADATVVTAGLSAVPSTGLHVRGTFAGADLLLVAAAALDADTVRQLRLGANAVDPDLTGHSLIDGTDVTLHGNFGVSYRLEAELSAPTALAVNPRAGSWAGAARTAEPPASLGTGFAVPTTGSVSANSTAAYLGSFSAAAELELLSAGGSNLPIHVLTWPGS